MEYQVFTTGDQLWTSQRDGKRVTVKLLTHDGWYWEEGQENRRLTGAEMYVQGRCLLYALASQSFSSLKALANLG